MAAQQLAASADVLFLELLDLLPGGVLSASMVGFSLSTSMSSLVQCSTEDLSSLCTLQEVEGVSHLDYRAEGQVLARWP